MYRKKTLEGEQLTHLPFILIPPLVIFFSYTSLFSTLYSALTYSGLPLTTLMQLRADLDSLYVSRLSWKHKECQIVTSLVALSLTPIFFSNSPHCSQHS